MFTQETSLANCLDGHYSRSYNLRLGTKTRNFLLSDHEINKKHIRELVYRTYSYCVLLYIQLSNQIKFFDWLAADWSGCKNAEEIFL